MVGQCSALALVDVQHNNIGPDGVESLAGVLLSIVISPLVIQDGVYHGRLLNAGELEVSTGSLPRILGLRAGASWWLWWEFQPPYRPVYCVPVVP